MKTILFIIFLILLQEFYRRSIYNGILKRYNYFNESNKQTYNQTFETTYHKSKEKDITDSFGLYYDDIEYNLFEVDTTHNASIMKKSFLNKSPYQYDAIEGNIQNGDTILDCGCGTGNFSIYVANQFPKSTIIAITNSEKCLNEARKNIEAHFLEHRIQTILLDFDHLEQLPKELLFNKIFFLESHGYSKNRMKLFKQCKQRLKEKGSIYIRTVCFYDKDEKHLHHIIDFWKYNFSTTHNQCSDLKSTGFNNIQYMDVDAILLMLSYNPTTLFTIILFILWNSNILFNYTYMKAHLKLLHKGMKYVVIKATN